MSEEHIPARLTRASVAALAGVVLGYISHAAVAGTASFGMATFVLVGIITAVAAGAGWFLAVRRRGWLSLAAFVLTVQVAVHLGAVGVSALQLWMESQPAQQITHDHRTMVDRSLSIGLATMFSWLAFLAVHALAAAAAAVILVRAERVVWARARSIVQRLVVLVRLHCSHGRRVVRPIACHAIRWELPRARSCIDTSCATPRRGPPLAKALQSF
jgi:hypothetical protein